MRGVDNMARKHTLMGLTTPKLTAVNHDKADVTSASGAPSGAYRSRGALGAVTRSIDNLAARAEAAASLQKVLSTGQTMVELDTQAVDRSSIQDRMSAGDRDESYDLLKESISDTGQLTPILVRPHPNLPDRYQAAFGHRRLRACHELGIRVKAIVRDLSDEELFIAQGQENAVREDLTFFERARFAVQLNQNGYDRQVLTAALGVDKTLLSRMLSIARAIPEQLAISMGPCPGVGRTRWQELADRLSNSTLRDRIDKAVQTPEFKAESSAGRFQLLYDISLEEDAFPTKSQTKSERKAPADKKRSPAWQSPDGNQSVILSISKKKSTLQINHTTDPGFSEFIVSRLSDLYSDYYQDKPVTSESDP